MQYTLISPRVPKLSWAQQILMNRGIAPAEAEHYLNTTDADFLNPSLIKNAKEGAQLLLSHIAAGSPMFVQIDEDLDGYSSAALFLNYLYAVFPDYTQSKVTYAPHHQKEHGIDMGAIPEDTKLVVVIDAGSNELEKHAALVARDIDILIIDHHIASEYSKDACVINNQLCDYPTKSLSGVGMAYKFCCLLDEILERNEAPRLADLAAIGCVGDMMELKDFETAHLVRKGLANPQNGFLLGMMEKNEFQLKGELTPHNVSWFIAPAVNAVARVGTYEERMLMFEAMLDFHSQDLILSNKRGARGQVETKVAQACRNCANVRNRQNKERDAGLEYIDELIAEKDLDKSPLLVICLEKDDFNPNIIGLMANQVAAKYNKPTLILHAVEDEEGAVHWQGSGRNVKGTDFANLQEYLQSTGFVEFAQGHENAFGVSIAETQIEEFKAATARDLKKYNFSATYPIDIEIEADYLTAEDVLTIGNLHYLWGEGVEEPWFKINNLKITTGNFSILKGNTVKITQNNGVAYMLFKATDEMLQELNPGDGYVTINLIGKCSCNTWGGITTPQIIIETYEIEQRCSYYF